ncbi:hypothetical protein ADIARSV_2348 [Arcticibacter svalbardensis MN12-7]|uniref:Uncharacterized protein n=1 Tax=Arcticibacter svalbardensis MN12-7 TaxID=1150600 RepID=R9GRM5_9SPHI|nr:hypothetical protein [Arcticibacter svalbardensis]EOR94502.1 hypothetical protein ADIARSV_2348 [Arcticibacter svalbardensis MN12-7]
MALIPGSPTNLANSMADAIQIAFNNHYKEVMGKDHPDANKQMTLLCVAVAEGVINHLKAHPEAFVIKTKFSDSTLYDAIVEIK